MFILELTHGYWAVGLVAIVTELGVVIKVELD